MALPVRAWWLRLYAAERRLEQAWHAAKTDPVKTTAAQKAALARGSAFSGMTSIRGRARPWVGACRPHLVISGPGTGKRQPWRLCLRALLSAGLCTAGRWPAHRPLRSA